MTERTNKAYYFAKEFHTGQFRGDGITPYIIHPKRVADCVQRLNGTEDQIVAALLHDVVEDSPPEIKHISRIRIENEFGYNVFQLVQTLTHDKSEPYLDYIKRVKKHQDASLIKICDIVDNLTDKPTERQKEKYTRALHEMIKDSDIS